MFVAVSTIGKDHGCSFRFEEDGISWRKRDLFDAGRDMGGGEERGEMEMEMEMEMEEKEYY